MKKLLILLFSLLISFNSYGEELKSLFGIALYDNAEKYVSSNYIDSNKSKNIETTEGYFDLNITNQIKSKSQYANYYGITIDNDNRIHEIYGHDEVVNIDVCLEIQKDLSSIFEEKYRIDLASWEKSLPTFKKYSRYHWTDSSNIISIQCVKIYKNSDAFRQIYFRSEVLSKAIEDFYNSGL
jgi:hypothetical protein